jgi:NhaP-type Na+/H+ or K+/H+ antiporter
LPEDTIYGLVMVIGFGILAQWMAWRLKLPSILFLLIFGFLAGPITGLLDPDKLFGDLLLPVVSISVAIILFEGGLTLRISELRETANMVRNMITIGVLVTWLATAALAYFILHLNLTLSVLMGAILVVTGPTVIGPLLRHIRPVGRVGNIIKWEGILNDPVGVLLAVLVFEAVLAGELQEASALIFFAVLKTLFFGVVVAGIGSVLLTFLLRRYWIPDFLQEAATLTIMVIVFVISNHFQEESGLFAVTIMGIVLANQKKVSIQHIVDFKENLRVLIISSLFIILAARMQLSDLAYIDWNSVLFLIALILVVRPLAVALSSIKSDLNWKMRLFVAWMAPRGIVAAAISAVFALRLSEVGVPQTEYLVPIIFMVIIGTVGVYGSTAPLLARWLKIGETDPQGVTIVGAHSWARDIAKALREEGFKVLLIDSNRHNEYISRMEGLNTYHGSVLSEYIFDELEFDGIGRLIALTSNDEANSLAALHFSELFGRAEVFQLVPDDLEEDEEEEFSPQHLRGRFLFGKGVHYAYLTERFTRGAVIKKTKLTRDFDYAAFKKLYGQSAIPLFSVTETGKLQVFTAELSPEPQTGQTLISVVDPVDESGETK